MRDSLDLNALREEPLRIKRRNRRHWVIYWVSMAIISVISVWVIFDIVTNRPDCSNNIILCRLIVLFFALLPFLWLHLGIPSLLYWHVRQHNRQRRRLLERLPPLNLPSSNIRLLSSIEGLLILWLILCFFLIMYFFPVFWIVPPLVFLPALTIIPLYLWAREPITKGNYQLALRRTEAVLRWLPRDVSFWVLCGVAAQQGGDLEQALKAARQALACALKQAPSDTIIPLNNLAVVWIYQGRYADALPLLEIALSINPEQGNVYNSLAYWYLYQNIDAERALEIAERAVQLVLASKIKIAMPMLLATRAWAEARTHRASRAAKTVDEALNRANPKNVPEYAETYRIAGEAMRALGNVDAVQEFFRQAAVSDPNGLSGRLAREALTELDAQNSK